MVERKFTARFVGLSGQQNMMFGLWYIVITFTSKVQTTEVRKSIIFICTEAERVLALLNRLASEIQGAKKAYGEGRLPEYNIEVIKKRVIEIIW